MTEDPDHSSEGALRGWGDVVVRFALVAVVVYWAFLLLRPFVTILVWAAILSVALLPAHRGLYKAFNMLQLPERASRHLDAIRRLERSSSF